MGSSTTNRPRSIDGVIFREGHGEIWGTQLSIDAAFSTSDPDVFLYVPNYGSAVMPRVSSHYLIQRRNSEQILTDSIAATEGGSLNYVNNLAQRFAKQYDLLPLQKIPVESLPK